MGLWDGGWIEGGDWVEEREGGDCVGGRGDSDIS